MTSWQPTVRQFVKFVDVACSLCKGSARIEVTNDSPIAFRHCGAREECPESVRKVLFRSPK